ncbi:hypothetical protein B8A44_07545 [Dolosigranulum pigrum]|uniref:Uncharacterized protein n=1 Tax=Dolosigranulum pigrum TaxID=29394 RepID=A0A328KPV7_9LACT|nr:hypothetical protein [Dolosigranulum pigrum]RAN62393.1 hypothetical protein B8A44_07545 [Dolosigranulum pigrum]
MTKIEKAKFSKDLLIKVIKTSDNSEGINRLKSIQQEVRDGFNKELLAESARSLSSHYMRTALVSYIKEHGAPFTDFGSDEYHDNLIKVFGELLDYNTTVAINEIDGEFTL